jgi:glycosyltransferase involved in cell wall biosynthesis
MEQLTISVIIPAFNAVFSLAQTIDSVLLQTVLPDQTIVINDGSTDETERVAKSYGKEIIYLEQKNQGQGAARNAGLSVAAGSLVAFLDADDYWKPRFLERCAAFLRTHPETVAVTTGLITRMHNGTEILHPPLLRRPNAPKDSFVIDDFYAFWAEHDHVRTGSAVIRKSVIDQAGFQRADLRVSQDLEYWGYIATYGKWGYIPEPLWVGNSRTAARAPGWLQKYQTRRKLCPTVEAWQERILPRLAIEQHPYFKVVRGRVAAGYVHHMILAERYDEAFHIFRTYGRELPANRVTRLLQLGNHLGRRIGWRAACLAIRAKEHWKAARL